jgi:hypothetical protein
MKTMKFKTRVGSDGTVKLEFPAGVRNADVEVVVVVQRTVGLEDAETKRAEWLAFLDATYGSLADDPIERPSQGEYEVRDEIE